MINGLAVGQTSRKEWSGKLSSSVRVQPFDSARFPNAKSFRLRCFEKGDRLLKLITDLRRGSS